MTPRWIAFAIVLLSEALVLGGLVVSIVRPERRVWPAPRGARSWQFWWSWGFLGVAVAGSLVLAWFDRGTFVFDHWVWKVAGVGIVAAAEFFNERAVRAVGRPASRGLGGPLVTRGPYGRTRNPQYLAQSAMVVGLVLVADSTLLAIAAVPGIVSLLLTPFAEEKWLEEHHGEAYRRYRERVPRFLGRRGGGGPESRSEEQ
ncbi:MAG: hypothetical protein KY397_04680 [Gemmatimonadetes bacterium]|nr:hypothetical protein [Gemmatimonadota bacterium]